MMKPWMNLYPRCMSIHAILKQSYQTILTVMVCPLLALLIAVFIMTSQYRQRISNINTASDIQAELGGDLALELWNVVSGQKDEKDEAYKAILENVERQMEILHKESQADTLALGYVEAAERALDTLRGYAELLYAQIARQVSMSESEAVFRDSKSVIGMIESMMQQYVQEEIDIIAIQNQHIQRIIFALMILILLIVMLMIFFSVCTYFSVMNGILGPIRNMEQMTNKVRAGDLSATVEETRVAELSSLCEDLNLMVKRIQDLLDEQIRTQGDLRRAELRILQEQITPHFVYNTMGTIVWLAEKGRTGDVVDITMAFTDFFRISLSRGRDFIQVWEEVRHIESYIEIQKIRYAKLMTCDILVDPSINDCMILKLVLQPLVENAIYHGLKEQRKKGHIRVMGVKTMTGNLMFVVEDNGMGMKEEVLQQLKKALGRREITEKTGVGLFNVNRRLQLYYKTAGLQIESTYGVGTSVSFEVPMQRGEVVK